MCGITGFLQLSTSVSYAEMAHTIGSMTDQIHHRGPDASGQWIDAEHGLALGHRRLSIIDLSSAGAQPMSSASSRYVIAFNGEIYNFPQLRQLLEQSHYPFVGHCDTEVLLAAIERWGLSRTLDSIEGMFAFALWDRQQHVLTLARDRVGKKPLYYGWCGQVLMFASELKALTVHPAFDNSLDKNALGQFIQFGWISDPLCIYKHIRKLPPGAFISIKAQSSPWNPSVERYWSADKIMEAAAMNRFTGSFSQAVDHLDELLTQAVSRRMVADVDLGALLSGGIDSSTVVGMMQKLSDRPVKTFSIGFKEEKYNEAHYAAQVAKHLGTEHHELYVSPQQCLDVVAQLPRIYDEPFGDISQVPTFLVSQLARRSVKVVLTGDGGDETFAGYNHYKESVDQWRWLSLVPAAWRRLGADILTSLGERSWHPGHTMQTGSAAKINPWQKFGAKLPRKTRKWRAACPQELLFYHYTRTLQAESMVPGSHWAKSHLTDSTVWSKKVNALPAMLHYDYIGYMTGDILVKVDRATMAVGLEARCPILDQHITEFAWTLPETYLLDKKGGKKILKEVLNRYVPRQITDRPKRGFGVPIEDWLRGPLKEWAYELISDVRLRDEGNFAPQLIRKIWDQHVLGWSNHANLLWSILMFQSWNQERKLLPQCTGK